MIFRNQNDEALEKEIAFLLKELEQHRDTPEKYADTIERISKLSKLQTHQGFQPPSLDTVLIVGANIFGILWLTRYERENPITTKALSFVMKPK